MNQVIDTERKAKIMKALYEWIDQRPGLDSCNYGDVSSYRSEMRRITQQRHDASRLMHSVGSRQRITADQIIEASKIAYSGRLYIVESDDKVTIEYHAGQYWPTEYRAVVCAVMSLILWEAQYESLAKLPNITNLGDKLRANFHMWYGPGIAKRWFN